MSKEEDTNGGGYGYVGAQDEANQTASSLPRSDGPVDALAGQTDNDTLARPSTHNGQSQIAYGSEHYEEE